MNDTIVKNVDVMGDTIMAAKNRAILTEAGYYRLRFLVYRMN